MCTRSAPRLPARQLLLLAVTPWLTGHECPRGHRKGSRELVSFLAVALNQLRPNKFTRAALPLDVKSKTKAWFTQDIEISGTSVLGLVLFCDFTGIIDFETPDQMWCPSGRGLRRRLQRPRRSIRTFSGLLATFAARLPLDREHRSCKNDGASSDEMVWRMVA